jgi:hypothetical protein
LNSLTAAPWNLIKGASVFASVQAYNALGSTVNSPLGNGAIVVLVPDSPQNLSNVPAQTT